VIIYRAFSDRSIRGLPSTPCHGCSIGATRSPTWAHVNDATPRSCMRRAPPQKDIERLKAADGLDVPWYTLTDNFDKDFGVDEYHGHNCIHPRPTGCSARISPKLARRRGWEPTELPHMNGARPSRRLWEDSRTKGYPQTPPYKW